MRTPRLLPALIVVVMAFPVLGASVSAHAELGGTMSLQGSSVAGPPRVLLNGALRVRTFTDAGATTINEYATSTGLIVAYTWQGPTMPDLHALLGLHVESYRVGAAAALASASGGNLHASRIERPDVIVESGGPMRSYAGRAWLPAALPSGVTADDFQ